MKIKTILKNSILKVWNYITLLHVNEAKNELKRLQIQLLNQYVFLLGLIFFTYAVRDLFYNLTESFYILGLLSIVIFLTLFFTRIRLNNYVLFSFCLLISFVIFYFSSYTGLLGGTYMYNFAHLSAILFLFGSKEKLFIIILYLLIITLFLINFITDFQLFFNTKYSSPSLAKKTFLLTFMQTIMISCINGIYLHKRFYLHSNMIRSKLRSHRIISSKNNIIVNLENQINKPLLFDNEELISLAKSSPKYFLNQFHKKFPTLLDRLTEINPKITDTEFKTLALIRVGLSSKEISSLEYVSLRTVETRKNRLRKKFGLCANSDINLWLKEINSN